MLGILCMEEEVEGHRRGVLREGEGGVGLDDGMRRQTKETLCYHGNSMLLIFAAMHSIFVFSDGICGVDVWVWWVGLVCVFGCCVCMSCCYVVCVHGVVWGCGMQGGGAVLRQ